MLTKYLILAGYFLVLFPHRHPFDQADKDIKDYYVGGKSSWIGSRLSTRATGSLPGCCYLTVRSGGGVSGYW